MKVHDPIDQPLAHEQIERCDEVEQQRRTAGEDYGVCPAHGRKRCRQQRDIRHNSPDQSGNELLLLVFGSMQPDGLDRSGADRLGLLTPRFGTRQPNLRNGPALLRPFACLQHRVLPNRSEVWRQPVTDIDKTFGHELSPAEWSDSHTAIAAATLPHFG